MTEQPVEPDQLDKPYSVTLDGTFNPVTGDNGTPGVSINVEGWNEVQRTMMVRLISNGYSADKAVAFLKAIVLCLEDSIRAGNVITYDVDGDDVL